MPTPTVPVRSRASIFLSPTNLGFSGTPSALAWNVPAVLANYFQPIQPSTTASYLVGKTWEVSEKLSTAYSWPRSIMICPRRSACAATSGVQAMHTQQSSPISNTHSCGRIGDTDSRWQDYNDVLPSANLVFGFPQIRSCASASPANWCGRAWISSSVL